MSLFFNRTATLANTLTALGYPLRSRASNSPRVDTDTALRHSGVWACLRLRADLVSTTPLDVFRTAFFAYSTGLVARAARVLGKSDDAAGYEESHRQIKAAFRRACGRERTRALSGTGLPASAVCT